MRHLKSGRRFRRTSAHQKGMFTNLVTNLLRYERVQTTEAKAKELRRVAEKTIHWGVRLGELLIQSRAQMKPDERARIIHSMRMARRVVKNREVLQKLFDDVASRYLGRPGGYTRITKVRRRLGDAAPISLVELLPVDGAGAEPAKAKAEAHAAAVKAAAAAKARGQSASRDVPKSRAMRETEAKEKKQK